MNILPNATLKASPQMLIKALIATGGLALISTGAAAYFRLDAKLQKERAAILEESNDALRADLKAHTAATAAYNETLSSLTSAARASQRAVEQARKTDATLDACLRYDPGIDLTGGLLHLDED